jgi:DNA polymerase III subunit delta
LILQSLDELERALKSGRSFSCYVILGLEKYFCRLALQLLKQELIARDAIAFNYTELSGESDSVDAIIAALNTFPMMSPLRLVFVSNVAKMGKETHQPLIEYLKNPCPKSVLVIEADELDRRTGFFKTLGQVACILDFPKLKGNELERWTARYIQKGGFKISSASIRKLIDLAGVDLQTLVNEIEKLQVISGSKHTISDLDIENLVGGSRQHGIFELTKAISRNDRVGALIHLNNLLDTGEKPLVILSMLARHYRQVLIAKEVLSQGGSPHDAAAAAQIPGFVAGDFLEQIKKIRREEAERMFLHIAKADLRLKSTGIREKILLETILCL